MKSTPHPYLDGAMVMNLRDIASIDIHHRDVHINTRRGKVVVGVDDVFIAIAEPIAAGILADEFESELQLVPRSILLARVGGGALAHPLPVQARDSRNQVSGYLDRSQSQSDAADHTPTPVHKRRRSARLPSRSRRAKSLSP